jgi:hypothetical protein
MCLFVYVSLVFVIYLMEAAKEAALQSEVPIFILFKFLQLLLVCIGIDLLVSWMALRSLSCYTNCTE